jgi:hypothetical protein
VLRCTTTAGGGPATSTAFPQNVDSASFSPFSVPAASAPQRWKSHEKADEKERRFSVDFMYENHRQKLRESAGFPKESRVSDLWITLWKSCREGEETRWNTEGKAYAGHSGNVARK